MDWLVVERWVKMHWWRFVHRVSIPMINITRWLYTRSLELSWKAGLKRMRYDDL